MQGPTHHPLYAAYIARWQKWWYAYEGGYDFINRYMEKLSDRESDEDFLSRKNIAYCPRFAGAAVDDVKNAIFQRMVDVERIGGAKSYKDVVNGEQNGVDLNSSSMNTFIGTEIIARLLVQTKIGVLIDMPKEEELGETQADKKGKRPYLSTYTAEQILSWAPKNPINGFDAILLQETIQTEDELGLPSGEELQYRYMTKTGDGKVKVVLYGANWEEKDEIILNIAQVPFVVMEIPISLMSQTADYQIALLNLESSDIAFSRKANFPFYYEYYDPKTENIYQKSPAAPNATGTGAEAKSKERETRVGLSQGRRYAKGIDKPGYINPEPDILRVSMEKGTQLKRDIRLLINLNLTALNPQRQAVESKEHDNRSLEASLSYIGLVLQKGEAQIGLLWNMFEGSSDEVKVTYPRTYNLKTEEQRLEHAKEYANVGDKVPSNTFRKAVSKKIASVLVSGDVSEEDYKKIQDEIDNAEALTVDPDVILRAHEQGLVDDVTASDSLGYNGEKIIEQARKDRAERVKLTLEAQTSPIDGKARGVPELGGEGEVDREPRGEGKKVDKDGE